MLINDIIKKADEININMHNKEVIAKIKIILDKYSNLYIIELNRDTKTALCLISAYEIQVGYFDLNYVLDNCSHAKIDDTFIPTYINEIYKNKDTSIKKS